MDCNTFVIVRVLHITGAIIAVDSRQYRELLSIVVTKEQAWSTKRIDCTEISICSSCMRYIAQVTPLGPKQFQLSGLSPGVTSVNVWDSNGKFITYTVAVRR